MSAQKIDCKVQGCELNECVLRIDAVWFLLIETKQAKYVEVSLGQAVNQNKKSPFSDGLFFCFIDSTQVKKETWLFDGIY